MEWSVLSDIQVVLEVQAKNILLPAERETNPVLAGSIPAFEMFMTSWEYLAEKHPRLKPWINIGLEWASTYYSRMDLTKSYIIAMCK